MLEVVVFLIGMGYGAAFLPRPAPHCSKGKPAKTSVYLWDDATKCNVYLWDGERQKGSDEP